MFSVLPGFCAPLGVLFVVLMVCAPARASAACAVNHCGLLTDGAYKNYVIGTLTHIGTKADIERVYRWARTHGYWKSLPHATGPYLKYVELVTITPSEKPGARRVTVFMQRSEFNAAPYTEGDLVRYTPHTSDMEAPKGHPAGMKLFRGLTGCVATLCSQTDKPCLSRYRMGLFTKHEGKAISLKTGRILKNDTGIDPVSLLPNH